MRMVFAPWIATGSTRHGDKAKFWTRLLWKYWAMRGCSASTRLAVQRSMLRNRGER